MHIAMHKGLVFLAKLFFKQGNFVLQLEIVLYFIDNIIQLGGGVPIHGCLVVRVRKYNLVRKIT